MTSGPVSYEDGLREDLRDPEEAVPPGRSSPSSPSRTTIDRRPRSVVASAGRQEGYAYDSDSRASSLPSNTISSS